ncbi:MAG: LysR substrate-binding domain-containing protein, partial [Gammaproteobacteria bacterium]|nr:LysR substrate-binding domain-containing protein [Gammaproteobacteria bacterium]
MKLKELELLHSLMSVGSVSDAARTMRMSQPNASKMLKKMENNFGFQLFERINSRLHPTEEARLLFDPIERALLSLRQFHSMTEEVRNMRRGTLIIGGLPLLSRTWLPDIVGTYMSGRPGVSVTFHTRSSKKLIEWVGERQIDIALGMLSMEDPMVERSALIKMEFLAAIPTGHSLVDKEVVEAIDLDGQEFISLSFLDHTRDDIDRSLRQAGAVPVERAG